MESICKHLQAEERGTLASLRQQGWSMRAITHALEEPIGVVRFQRWSASMFARPRSVTV